MKKLNGTLLVNQGRTSEFAILKIPRQSLVAKIAMTSIQSLEKCLKLA
jgi:hypothetical protein